MLISIQGLCTFNMHMLSGHRKPIACKATKKTFSRFPKTFPVQSGLSSDDCFVSPFVDRSNLNINLLATLLLVLGALFYCMR